MTLIEGPHGRKFGTAARVGSGRRPGDRGGAGEARLLKTLTWGGIPGLVAGIPVGMHMARAAPGVWKAPVLPEQERQVGRELVELYRHRLGEPMRVAPELARLAEGFPDTPEGRSAREELAELKRALARARGGEAAGA